MTIIIIIGLILIAGMIGYMIGWNRGYDQGRADGMIDQHLYTRKVNHRVKRLMRK